MRKYLLIIEGEEGNYSAYSPDVPGCVATGKTISNTKKNMREALEFHIQGLIDEGEKIPEPVSRYSEFVEVA